MWDFSECVIVIVSLSFLFPLPLKRSHATIAIASACMASAEASSVSWSAGGVSRYSVNTYRGANENVSLSETGKHQIILHHLHGQPDRLSGVVASDGLLWHQWDLPSFHDHGYECHHVCQAVLIGFHVRNTLRHWQRHVLSKSTETYFRVHRCRACVMPLLRIYSTSVFSA